jgi:hypothetical protein
VIPPGRRRPFHWHQEGIVAITAMEAAMAEIGVVARAVVVPCGRRRQDAARAVALEETVLHLLDDGCERVIIEARTPAQDGRERQHLHELIHGWELPAASAVIGTPSRSRCCGWPMPSAAPSTTISPGLMAMVGTTGSPRKPD